MSTPLALVLHLRVRPLARHCRPSPRSSVPHGIQQRTSKPAGQLIRFSNSVVLGALSKKLSTCRVAKPCPSNSSSNRPARPCKSPCQAAVAAPVVDPSSKRISHPPAPPSCPATSDHPCLYRASSLVLRLLRLSPPSLFTPFASLSRATQAGPEQRITAPCLSLNSHLLARRAPPPLLTLSRYPGSSR